MAHVRQLIRDQFVTALSPSDIASTRVYNNRVDPMMILPAINVTTPTEAISDQYGEMGNVETRDLEVLVECYAEGSSTPDDTLDSLADEVVNTILNDSTLLGMSFDISIEEVDFSHSRDGNSPIGRADIRFAFLYQTDGTNPSVII